MLKTLNMTQIRCPVGSSGELMAVFQKWPKLTRRMTKNRKTSIFQSFYSNFVKFLTDFVDWNIGKGKKGNNLLSKRLFRRVICRSLNGRSQYGTENHKKTQNISMFKVFMMFRSKVRQTPWVGLLKTFIKVRICCPVVFYEEIIAVS